MFSDQIRDAISYFSKKGKIAFWILAVVAVALALVLPLTLPNSSLRKIVLTKDYQSGELADEDVYSPVTMSFLDEVRTAEIQRNAAMRILPIFTYDISGTFRTLVLFDDYITQIEIGSSDGARSLLGETYVDEHNVTPRLLSQSENPNRPLIIRLAREELERLMLTGVFSSQDLSNVRDDGYEEITREFLHPDTTITESHVSLSSLVTENDVSSSVLSSCVDYTTLSLSEGMLVSDLVSLFAKPNIMYDELETIKKREIAARDAGTEFVRISQGDLIIAKDTVITDRELRIIDEINQSRVNVDPLETIVNLAFLVAILSFTIVFLVFFIPYKARVPLYLMMFLSLLILTELFSFMIMSYSLAPDVNMPVDPILPVLFMPVFFALMTNKRRIGFTVGFVLAGFSVIYPTSTKFSFFYFLVIIESAVMFIRFGTNRIDMIYQALYSSLFVALVTVAFGILSAYTYQVIVQSVIVSVMNVIITYVAVSICLPITERIFNIPTVFRLQELSSSDSPTLNRLNQVAQGTFNHTRNVAEMSYLACREIGLNAELARVGALYHDIGKAEHPEYFIENQNGKNAHDMLTNNLSAAVIKSHVKLGVEKGREIGLPQEVLDIISEHHGNDIISYFYNEAKKNAQGTDITVREEDFRYTGNIPQTPESGIVMLADCVEAASRTLKNPNPQKYDRLIMNIMISKINYGQLSDSRLTLSDLFKVKDTFIRFLMGRDHQRIEYDK